MLNCPAGVEAAIWILFGSASAMLALRGLVHPRWVFGATSVVAIAISAGCIVSLDAGQRNNEPVEVDRDLQQGTADAPQSTDTTEIALTRGVPLLLLGVGALLSLLAWERSDSNARSPEEFSLLLMALASAMAATVVDNLLALFVAVELNALVTLGLLHAASTAAPDRSSDSHPLANNLHAGLLASCLLFYALSLVYGVGGTVNLADMRGILLTVQGATETTRQASTFPLFGKVAVVLLFSSFGLKSSALLFQVAGRQSLPRTPNWGNAYLAIIPTVVAITVLYRLCGIAMVGGESAGAAIAIVFAGLAMLIGNWNALRDDRIHSMIAYSAIAHGGVAMAGLAVAIRGHATYSSLMSSATPIWSGFGPLIFFLSTYCLAYLGLTAVLFTIHSPTRPVEFVDDLKGLAQTQPFSGLCLLVCLISLMAIPPLAGFWGYLWLLFATADLHIEPSPTFLGFPVQVFALLGVLIVLHLSATVALYGRLLIAVLVDQPLRVHQRRDGKAAWIAGLLAAALLALLGLVPHPLFWLVR